MSFNLLYRYSVCKIHDMFYECRSTYFIDCYISVPSFDGNMSLSIPVNGHLAVVPINLLFGETGLPNIFWQRDKSTVIDSARFNDFLSVNSRPSASPIESQIVRNYAHVRFRPEAISYRITNECAFRLPSRFLVDAYGAFN